MQTVDCTAIGNDAMVRSNIGAFMGSFDGNGNTIDGDGSVILNINYSSIKLVYNGTQWNIL